MNNDIFDTDILEVYSLLGRLEYTETVAQPAVYTKVVYRGFFVYFYINPERS